MNRLTQIAICLVLLGFAALPKLAQAQVTISAMVPTGRQGLVIIEPSVQPLLTGIVAFKFSAPGAGNAYALNFCIGPAANPCGLAHDFVVNVPEGQSRLAVANARILTGNVLVVTQGTNVPVPFSVSLQ